MLCLQDKQQYTESVDMASNIIKAAIDEAPKSEPRIRDKYILAHARLAGVNRMKHNYFQALSLYAKSKYL